MSMEWHYANDCALAEQIEYVKRMQTHIHTRTQRDIASHYHHHSLTIGTRAVRRTKVEKKVKCEQRKRLRARYLLNLYTHIFIHENCQIIFYRNWCVCVRVLVCMALWLLICFVCGPLMRISSF